jgi:antitoxin ParD1/3/4
MSKNTSVSIGDHFEDFINKEIEKGRYQSRSEVIRAALRLLENEERKAELLRQALIEGEESEMIENFDSRTHLESLRK